MIPKVSVSVSSNSEHVGQYVSGGLVSGSVSKAGFKVWMNYSYENYSAVADVSWLATAPISTL